jgi:hypothetical protein
LGTKEKNMREIWLPVKDYEGVYSVSSRGRIRSEDRVSKVPPSRIKKVEHTCVHYSQEMKLSPHRDGYLKISLCLDDVRRTPQVHRLVASAFIPNPLNLPQVNHKDGCKTNNCKDNLEWVSRSENIKHAYSTGLMDTRGEKNSRHKFTEAQILECLKLLKDGLSGAEAGRRVGIPMKTVSRLKRGKSWKHLQ